MDSFLEQLFACYTSNITTSNGGQAGSGGNNTAQEVNQRTPARSQSLFLPASQSLVPANSIVHC